MKTWTAKPDEVEKKWWIIDASEQRLGRVATRVATLLRGKHKPIFTPHVDTGDFVIVINADKVEMTGTKWSVKKYYTHSRFFGSLKEKSAEQMKKDDPAFVIQEAVRGMLPPQSKLTNSIITKLKVYSGSEHPHAAQKPEAFTISK